MTTDRTAIRRRLAIRSAAHRPPWGARKAGHDSIVAPLAATVAATVTVAVGVRVGLALARSERERRRAHELARERERQLELDRQLELERGLALGPGEQLGDGLRRMALGQVDLALEMLDTGDGTAIASAPDERAVHETRKALKRLRALVRLLEGELGGKACAREDAALRDAARSLAGARDAAVMLSTLDALMQRHPRTLGRRRGVLELRRRLRAEHARMERHTLADPAARAQTLGELHALRWRVDAWSLSDRDGVEPIEADLVRLYRQGRTRYRRVARGKGDRMIAMHEWRKRVKDLRYAAEMLERRGTRGSSDASGGSRNGSRSHGGSARSDGSGWSLRQLARRADELGELLGEEHDLAVLVARLRAGGLGGSGVDQTWYTGRRTRERLLKQIAKRRRTLRKRALRDGRRLYRDEPKVFVRRVRAAYARDARRVS
jgi:CHAD domain-containing protein